MLVSMRKKAVGTNSSKYLVTRKIIKIKLDKTAKICYNTGVASKKIIKEGLIAAEQQTQ